MNYTTSKTKKQPFKSYFLCSPNFRVGESRRTPDWDSRHVVASLVSTLWLEYHIVMRNILQSHSIRILHLECFDVFRALLPKTARINSIVSRLKLALCVALFHLARHSHWSGHLVMKRLLVCLPPSQSISQRQNDHFPSRHSSTALPVHLGR